MDPNANLREQDYLVAQGVAISSFDRRRLLELRLALSEWLSNDGFAPHWRDYPEASKAYDAWQLRIRGLKGTESNG